MDYEQKYKQALERAKNIIEYYKKHHRCDEASIEDLESIFPELKESEDERVRKGIIKYLSWIKDRDGSYMPNNIPFDDMIIWLEKQGEQKPVDFKAKDWYVSKVDGKIHNMTYNPTDKVEPNPTWSEADERNLKSVISRIKEFGDSSVFGLIDNDIQWLKSLKERLKGE